MSRVRDAWYIRLPNGQEIKAKSTAAVLHHVQGGEIPRNSFARRSRDEEWQQLEWHVEFMETITGIVRPRPAPEPEKPAERPVPPQLERFAGPESLAGIAARLDPMRLKTVGVRGLMDDLIAALDSTFAPGKLTVAVVAAALIGLIWGGIPWGMNQVMSALEMSQSESDAVWLSRVATLVCAVPSLIVLALAVGLLTRMTHLELSNMRRVRVSTAMRGYSGLGIRLALAYVLVLGGAVALMYLLQWFPGFASNQLAGMDLPGWLLQSVPAVLSIFALAMQVFLWLLIGLSWLLAPIMVAEDYSLFAGIAEWLGLVRARFNRIVLAQTMTLALGVLVALPIVLPVWYSISQFPYLPHPVRMLVYGLSLAGFVAFMSVASVFTYLEVKYEGNDS